MQSAPRGIRAWNRTGSTPVVRIGVVLAEDHTRELRLRTPSDGIYALEADSQRIILDRKTTLHARSIDSERMSFSAGAQPLPAVSGLAIYPSEARPDRRNDGVLVEGVVAGRGFHWQKRVDQTLAGRIEIIPSAEGLVLVNELPLESYLASVITSEMSSACPVEFLRAQCITARSWLLAMTESKHDGEQFDRCNDDCCQRYQGTGELTDVAIEATTSTAGIVLLASDGRIVDANYSKSCGGIVELPEHVWGVHKPGLAPQVDAPKNSRAERFMPVTDAYIGEFLEGGWLAETDIYCSPNVVPEDSLSHYLGRVDETGQYFRWRVRYSHDELLSLLRRKLSDASDLDRITKLHPRKRGISGRITELAIDYTDSAGSLRTLVIPDQYRIRQVLHESFLFSSAFIPRIERDASGNISSVTLVGAGWGHGAGLCQIGALGMSLLGIDHARILRHYFPAATLSSLY